MLSIEVAMQIDSVTYGTVVLAVVECIETSLKA